MLSNNGNWYSKALPEIYKELHSTEQGLSKVEAKRRSDEYGLNKLPEGKVDSPAVIFLRQFQSPLIYILFAVSLIIFLMGQVVDSIIILGVLIFNAIIGTIQEGKAQNTLLALKNFTETKATVLREGKELIIPDRDVVTGDIIILYEGEKIPADARIISAYNLRIDEAAMTGESVPVHKISDTLDISNDSALTQKNTVFKGTHIVLGNGKAIVVAIGIDTVIGKIAKEIATIDTETPLRANIRHLSRLIIVALASISVSLFSLGVALGKPAEEMFRTVLSLAVSIIPEGLPVVMTIVLATGVWRMSKQNVLIKRLHAVEALGQARVIAVDKTGTITKNEIVIQKVFVDGKFFDIGGIGYETTGEIQLNRDIVDPANHPELLFAGKIAALCSNARVQFSEESGEWRVVGDPTEAAILTFAKKLGFHKDNLEKESPLVTDFPFDYKLKYHAAVHLLLGQKFLSVAGAPEVILGLSERILRGGKNHPLLAEERQKLESVILEMSQKGLRVVAVAELRDAPNIQSFEDISALSFVGLFGMKDALRMEVADAMKQAMEAGIRVVMITGDHRETALAIATDAGIYHYGDTVLTGNEVDAMSDAELSWKLSTTTVFARVNPEHKLRIIQAYKARGEVVAMTGDGVNDAPSLVAADLGVAMGKVGTEVAKEASDIILLDDNFGNIVLAIEEGRNIYKTIKKVVLYFTATSAGGVLVITTALFIGYPLPLLAIHIIWLNFVTDGFLNAALAMEPKEEGLLRGNFAKPGKYLIDKLMTVRLVLMSVTMAIGTLYVFQGYFETDLAKALTMSLTSLAVFQWFNAWNCRSETKSIFQMNPFSNKYLLLAMFAIVSLQLLAVYNPLMQKILRTVPLDTSDWLLIITVASSIILAEEIRKFFYRRSSRAKLVYTI